MASKKTLNESNLESLGAKRLAELLIEISAGNAAAKRLLRLELAGAQSPREIAKEIRKRLTTIARSRSFVDWENRKSLVDDLETQRRAIADQVAKRDPAEGAELMWRFLDLANSVFERCDDSSGMVIGIFHAACSDMGNISLLAKSDPKDLTDHVFQALIRNDYGQFDGLIMALTPALGQEGLEHLKQRMIALSKEPVHRPADKERKIIGFGSSGPIYADACSSKKTTMSTVTVTPPQKAASAPPTSRSPVGTASTVSSRRANLHSQCSSFRNNLSRLRCHSRLMAALRASCRSA